ncbi:Fic family protein [Corynebacterium sp. TAE3-ERU12]|uniref:Fic family protein n=1 Tax=Corynebacterium sp. TAE3-ERU12 TaxID=2849491 RepID=UPI001C464CFB|nr:Fic/DOC family N-terminal domain-containing protein [Corynebacterium sp. TAE3-ERU12]MBV7295990.1 Fic family protein [Corynebacterium sp. TAE3-ERU12]
MWPGPNSPYQSLPPLPPAGCYETAGVFKATIAATRALAFLDGACGRLPDATVLTNLIPLLEAKSSSEIENIVTTNDELFRAAHSIEEYQSPQVKEALRYRTALKVGWDEMSRRPITARTAQSVCTTILGRTALIRNHPGTYIGKPASQEKVYTPPEGLEVIQDHLQKWETWVNTQQECDPLVAMALAHYQFEAIHPFFDGNGRTGRILNMLILKQAGLLKEPILYLSGYILRHKDEYYRRLAAVTESQQWEEWIIFILNAVTDTAERTIALVEASEEAQRTLEADIQQSNRRIKAAEIAKLLSTQPYLRIENVVDAQIATRQTASKWLNEIADIGLITRLKTGRSYVFVNHRWVDQLFSYSPTE